MQQPQELRPGAGFCVQTESLTGAPPARWYINMTKHRMVEMPVAYSGKIVDREFIFTHGIGNLQIPFDIGSFRKLKMRSDGAKQATFCIDVVFNPLIIALFMEDEFCNKMENFRQFIMNLAIKRIDESIGVKLSTQKVTLVKKIRYKDGEDGDENYPREFTELPGNPDCFDQEYQPSKPAPTSEPPSEPLIEDLSKGRSKPALKKGFLNGSKGKPSAELYPNGSSEGVLPENAGDPLGYIPKKLRNTCKIVDCNSPEYQANEQARKSTEKTNAMNKEMTDTITSGFDFWQKKQDRDKWEQDLPDGTEEHVPKKYDNDYSRFDRIPDVVEETVYEERDWYYDEKGNRKQKDVAQKAVSSSKNIEPDLATPESDAAVKKGFFNGAKPLYPKGSTEGKPAPDEDKMMKELMRGLPADAPPGTPEEEQLMKELLRNHGDKFGDLLGSKENTPNSTQPVNVKVPEFKAADFTLNDVADGLQLQVTVPGLESMKGVNLDVTDRIASLAFPSSASLKPLKVELPKAVNPQAVRAKFSKKTQQVTISLPAAAA